MLARVLPSVVIGAIAERRGCTRARCCEQEVADNVIIQYGGSVNDANVDALMACADIDGALVGGASLSGEKFARIINFEPVKEPA